MFGGNFSGTEFMSNPGIMIPYTCGSFHCKLQMQCHTHVCQNKKGFMQHDIHSQRSHSQQTQLLQTWISQILCQRTAEKPSAVAQQRVRLYSHMSDLARGVLFVQHFCTTTYIYTHQHRSSKSEHITRSEAKKQGFPLQYLHLD